MNFSTMSTIQHAQLCMTAILPYLSLAAVTSTTFPPANGTEFMTTSTELSIASQPTQFQIFPTIKCPSLKPDAKRENINSHICCQPLIPVFENLTCNSIFNIDEAEGRCSLYNTTLAQCRNKCPLFDLICPNISGALNAYKCTITKFNKTSFDVCELYSNKTPNDPASDDAKCSYAYDVLKCYKSNINDDCGPLARDLFMMKISIFNSPIVYNDALETACLKLIKYFGEPGHPDLRLSSSTKTTLEPCRTTYLCFKEDTMHACCRPLLSVFKYNEYEDKDTITKVQERCSLYANATDCKLHCSWWSMICKDVTEFVKAARCVKNITTLTTCPTESPVEDNCDVVSNWANCVEKTVIETCGDLGRDIAMHAALKRDFEDGHMGFYSTLYSTFSGKIFESSEVRCLMLLDIMAHHLTFQHDKEPEVGHTDDFSEAPHTDVTISLAKTIKISTGLLITALIFAYRMKYNVDFVCV